MEKKLWSREELILAFNLYLQIPFGQIDKSNPKIIELAGLLGRTPGSVAMRLANFVTCDPFHQNRGVVGLKGGIKQCQPIWDEFAQNRDALLYESESILAKWQRTTIEQKYSNLLGDLSGLKGEEKARTVMTRVNQNTFRSIVLANYTNHCAISGIDVPDLLLASHILPWAESSPEERLDPENGICLSALYDRAFDKGLIGIKQNYEVVLSQELKLKKENEYFRCYFLPVEGLKLRLPQKYLPRKEFLQYHWDKIYRK